MHFKNGFTTPSLCLGLLGFSAQYTVDAYKWSDFRDQNVSTFTSVAEINFEEKKCFLCGKKLLAQDNSKHSHFYIISAKNEKHIRWESSCKNCKKKQRKNKKENTATGLFEKKLVAPPELLKSEFLEAHKKLPTMIEEKKFINDNSTKEGITNFNKFVSVLLEEYGRQVGASVYVKGKRS